MPRSQAETHPYFSMRFRAPDCHTFWRNKASGRGSGEIALKSAAEFEPFLQQVLSGFDLSEAVAAEAIRRILIDQARRKQANVEAMAQSRQTLENVEVVAEVALARILSRVGRHRKLPKHSASLRQRLIAIGLTLRRGSIPSWDGLKRPSRLRLLAGIAANCGVISSPIPLCLARAQCGRRIRSQGSLGALLVAPRTRAPPDVPTDELNRSCDSLMPGIFGSSSFQNLTVRGPIL